VTKIRDDKFIKAFGERVKQLRKEKGISTYKLSYDADISRSQINRIENGEVNTTISTAKALATALGVSVKSLFDIS